MPGGDRTGPLGRGSMTGRGAGYCAGYSGPGFGNLIPGRGFWGRGGRRSWFRGWGWPGRRRAAMGYPTAGLGLPDMSPAPAMTKEQELDALKGQAEYFEGALGEIKKRLEELEAQAK